MTKKSAARAKVVTPKSEDVSPKPEELSMEDKMLKLRKLFDENKWAFEKTVKTQVRTSERFDNFANLRDLAINVLGEDGVTIPLIQDLMIESTKSYELVLERVEKFEFDKFMEDEPYDYFEDIMPDPKQVVDQMDFLYGVVRFLSVKPYGDKMLQMWQTVQMTKKELGL